MDDVTRRSLMTVAGGLVAGAGAGAVAGQRQGRVDRPAGPPIAPREPIEPPREWRRPADFGARGDGNTDDTQAMQAAAEWARGGRGRAIFLPEGIYSIRRPIRIGTGGNWRIEGASFGATVIEQQTDGAPVILVDGSLSNGWRIADLQLRHRNLQPPGATDAVGILLDPPARSTVFNFSVERVFFDRSFRGIAQSNRAAQQAIWGVWLRGCVGGGALGGSLVNLMPRPAVGQPNIVVRECYIDCDRSAATEPAIAIGYCDNVLIDSVEFNKGVYRRSEQILLHHCFGTILNTKSEGATIAQPGAALWHFVLSQVNIIGGRTNGVSSLGPMAAALRMSSGTTANILGFSISSERVADTLIPWIIDNQSEIALLSGLHTAGRGIERDPRRIMGDVRRPRFDAGAHLPHGTERRGDADAALSANCLARQLFDRALAAPRRLTLPPVGAVPVEAEIEIVRSAPAPGAALTVDTGRGTHEIPANRNGRLRFVALPGGWVLIDANAF